MNIIRARFSVRFQSQIRSLTNSGRASAKICATPFVIKAPVAFAGMSVDDTLTTRRDLIGQEAMRFAQAEIDRLGLGIQLLAFETREINPPAPVLPAFQDVVSAKVEAKTMVEPARSRARHDHSGSKGRGLPNSATGAGLCAGADRQSAGRSFRLFGIAKGISRQSRNSEDPALCGNDRTGAAETSRLRRSFQARERHCAC